MAYKIERLGLGGILDQAIAISKDHFGLLFSIMLLLVVPYFVVAGGLELAMTPELPPEATEEEMVAAQIEAMQASMPWILALTAVYMIFVIPITNGAVIHAIGRLYLGQEITAIEAIKQGMQRFLPLVGTSILMFVIITIGFVLCIIPGIYFSIWYGLGQHVVILEGLSGMTALRRSKQLVHPQRGTFLALLLITAAINWGINMGAALIPQPIVSIVTGALAQGVTTILWTAALVVFYFSARCVVDNFDLHYLAQSIDAAEADEPEFGVARP